MYFNLETIRCTTFQQQNLTDLQVLDLVTKLILEINILISTLHLTIIKLIQFLIVKTKDRFLVLE